MTSCSRTQVGRDAMIKGGVVTKIALLALNHAQEAIDDRVDPLRATASKARRGASIDLLSQLWMLFPDHFAGVGTVLGSPVKGDSVSSVSAMRDVSSRILALLSKESKALDAGIAINALCPLNVA